MQKVQINIDSGNYSRKKENKDKVEKCIFCGKEQHRLHRNLCTNCYQKLRKHDCLTDDVDINLRRLTEIAKFRRLRTQGYDTKTSAELAGY